MAAHVTLSDAHGAAWIDVAGQRAEAPVEGRWSARRTLLFVIATNTAAWCLLFVGGKAILGSS